MPETTGAARNQTAISKTQYVVAEQKSEPD